MDKLKKHKNDTENKTAGDDDGLLSRIKSKGRSILGEDFIIHITNNSRFILEGYKGISEYNDNFVRIKTVSGQVLVKGSDIQLKNMSDQVICVTGKLKSVEFDN